MDVRRITSKQVRREGEREGKDEKTKITLILMGEGRGLPVPD